MFARNVSIHLNSVCFTIAQNVEGEGEICLENAHGSKL
jgi:hypothetical protein